MSKAFLSVISELPVYALPFSRATLEVAIASVQEMRSLLKERGLFLYESSLWALESNGDKWRKKHQIMLRKVEEIIGGPIPSCVEVNHKLQQGESLFLVHDMAVIPPKFIKVHVAQDERSQN